MPSPPQAKPLLQVSPEEQGRLQYSWASLNVHKSQGRPSHLAPSGTLQTPVSVPQLADAQSLSRLQGSP
jgi:hypothetical protein